MSTGQTLFARGQRRTRFLCLLHLFFQLPDIRQNVQVVHIDHRLQDESKKWADFTAELAREYGFTFNALSVSTKPVKGDSIEDWARTERYSLLKNELQDNDVLFTAHHLDDQVETFFLQALRGDDRLASFFPWLVGASSVAG